MVEDNAALPWFWLGDRIVLVLLSGPAFVRRHWQKLTVLSQGANLSETFIAGSRVLAGAPGRVLISFEGSNLLSA